MSGSKWHFQRIVIYVLAVILPPIMVGIMSALVTMARVMVHQDPAPVSEPVTFEAPRAPKGKKTAIILLSNKGTQLSEVLLTANVLGESGDYAVFTAAPERELSATTGAVAIFPHMRLNETPRPDVIVIPSLLQGQEEELLGWIRENAPNARWIVTLGEGVTYAASAGLLDGRAAATHFVARDELQKRFPDIRFLSEHAWVRSGKILSSPGLHATTTALSRLITNSAAGREETEFGPRHFSTYDLSGRDTMRLIAQAAFDWSSILFGMELRPNINEVSLAAVLEVFPRSFAARSFTFNESRSPVISKNGLILVPTYGRDSIEKPDYWVESGSSTSDAPVESSIPAWSFDPRAQDPFVSAVGFLAANTDEGLARLVGKLLLLPSAHIPEGSSWRFWFAAVLKVLGLSMAGLAIVAFFDHRFMLRQQASSGSSAPPLH